MLYLAYLDTCWHTSFGLDLAYKDGDENKCWTVPFYQRQDTAETTHWHVSAADKFTTIEWDTKIFMQQECHDMMIIYGT